MTDALNLKAGIMRAIGTMAAQWPADWEGPSFWQDVTQQCANIIFDLGDGIDPRHLAVLMSVGAAAHRQSKHVATEKVRDDRPASDGASTGATVVQIHPGRRPASNSSPRVVIEAFDDLFSVTGLLTDGASDPIGFPKHEDALVHAMRLRAMFGWPIDDIGETLS